MAYQPGKIEVVCDTLMLLNRTINLPFQLDEGDVNEALRLQYRYLDLRRDRMQRNIRLRHVLIQTIRSYLNECSFTEIETPILTRSTPEGARDYLVPSRVHTGSFYALPQSPQMFKQMLVIAGFERYYQIARCFRDEDLRADRQLEFTQLDIEMAFITEQDIMQLMEKLFRKVFENTIDTELPDKFPKMSYSEALRRFGTDRPDLRIPFEITDLTDAMKSEEFQVFRRAANMEGGRVAALRVPSGNSLTRQQIDDYTKYVVGWGAKGLAYIKVNEIASGRDGLQSPILKFLSDEAVDKIAAETSSRSGDMIFFGADHASIVNASLGALRVKIAEDLNQVESGWRPLWVVDFPLVEYDETEKRWQSLHHPFTAPKESHVSDIDEFPESVLSRAYDLVFEWSRGWWGLNQKSQHGNPEQDFRHAWALCGRN